MPIIIGLLILIVLLLIFGPWLLVALGILIAAVIALIAAVIAGVVWVVKTLLVPAGIVLLIGIGIAALAMSVLFIWVGIDRVAASSRLAKRRRPKAVSPQPIPPIVRPKTTPVRPTKPWDR